MALSKLPRDAVPLDAQEEAAWIESLQGDWDIEAVDLEAIAQVNNKYVKPIGFKTAKVTGKTYVMGGGPDGQADVFLYKIPVHGASLPRRMGLDAYDAGLAENAPDARTGR